MRARFALGFFLTTLSLTGCALEGPGDPVAEQPAAELAVATHALRGGDPVRGRNLLLDGVWATAPYFHNGSVPRLDAVLNPALRPTVFRRSFNPDQYDFERLGYPYTKVSSKGSDVTVYDTRRDGYRNTGHTFAAGLSDAQRRDLLEYLKTL